MLRLATNAGNSIYELNVFHITCVAFESGNIRFDLLNKSAITLHDKTAEDLRAYTAEIKALKAEAFASRS